MHLLGRAVPGPAAPGAQDLGVSTSAIGAVARADLVIELGQRQQELPALAVIAIAAVVVDFAPAARTRGDGSDRRTLIALDEKTREREGGGWDRGHCFLTCFLALDR